jgi:wobble nucleotide-excising tRNase
MIINILQNQDPLQMLILVHNKEINKENNKFNKIVKEVMILEKMNLKDLQKKNLLI